VSNHIPKELKYEWIRFVDNEPTLDEIETWIRLKAAEIEWEILDLSEALFLGVKKPVHFLKTPEPELN
jgi:hypothetical protein